MANMTNIQLDRWSKDFGLSYTKRCLDLNFSPTQQKKRLQSLKAALAHTKGIKRILEVGCNTGHNFFNFAKLGKFEMVGIDPQAEALKIGKVKKVPATLITGSTFDIPFFDNYFDFVMTAGVLMHISRRNIGKAIKEIERVTSKYFFTTDYFDDQEVSVHYHGYDNMLWRRDIRHEISKHSKNFKLIWKKRYWKDQRTGKYTWAFLYEKSKQK